MLVHGKMFLQSVNREPSGIHAPTAVITTLKNNSLDPRAKHSDTELQSSTREVEEAERLHGGGRKLERASTSTQRLSFLCDSQLLKGK